MYTQSSAIPCNDIIACFTCWTSVGSFIHVLHLHLFTYPYLGSHLDATSIIQRGEGRVSLSNVMQESTSNPNLAYHSPYIPFGSRHVVTWYSSIPLISGQHTRQPGLRHMSKPHGTLGHYFLYVLIKVRRDYRSRPSCHQAVTQI